MSQCDLSDVVSARLCHDLISPMGAIGNGLELLQMAGSSGSEELHLISDSLNNGLSKVRFFRIAFGPADSETDIKLEEVSGITDAMFCGRVRVEWHADVPRMRRRMARLLFLAVLCLEKSLPMGGQIHISLTHSGAELSVVGRRTAPHPELWDHVSIGNPCPEISSDNVQFPLLRQRLNDSEAILEVNIKEERISLTILLREPVSAFTGHA